MRPGRDVRAPDGQDTMYLKLFCHVKYLLSLEVTIDRSKIFYFLMRSQSIFYAKFQVEVFVRVEIVALEVLCFSLNKIRKNFQSFLKK